MSSIATAQDPRGYGRASHAVFNVEGPGFHNPSFTHEVRIWSDGTASLHALPTVIALIPDQARELAGTVRIGDRIKVDGTVYEITRKIAANPALVPVA